MLSIVFFLFNSVNAEDVQKPLTTEAQPKPATSYQNIMYEDCTKIFTVDNEKLFYLTIAAINANKFKIEEIQSYNGYIIFTAAKYKYLATVASIDKTNSMLKITPCNNVYYFQPGIISNMFKYIELNKNNEMK